MTELLAVEEAQARLLALLAPLPPEQAPLADAANRWLAHDVASLRTQPWADLSAMDGYALRHSELPGPWRLAGESAAGAALPPPLPPGAALRIFTGAPMPPGADCVLVQEEASVADGLLCLAGEGPSGAGRNVRAKGSDFAAGQIVAHAGERLSAGRIALLALAGHGTAPVRRRPRVALISTGNELVAPGMPTPPGKLPASNALMLAALLGAVGCEVADLGILPDDMDAIAAAIDGARGCDLLVTIGGASVGDHDLVRPALVKAGAAIDFWKVALKPGKPMMAGRIDDAVILGLPGNPVSAFVTAILFALPAVRALAGSASPLPDVGRAMALVPLPATGKRAELIRAVHDSGGVRPVASQDSAATLALAEATLLIRRPAQAPAVAPGEPVEIIGIA